MPSLSNCDRDRLRQLLDGELEPSVETDVTQHVGTCEVCRRQLESFAADESWWQGTRDALSAESDSNGVWSSHEPADNSPPNIPLDFLAPSDNPAMLGRLGEFEILEWIGCGGMGIVLKGYDHELNRYVAVKVLHPHCATSAAARRRFAREAQAAAAVVHQHVVAIYAVDGQHHPPYLVMPFVPGESLQQRLNRQGAFEVVDVLRIGQQVAEGLAAAHAQGLVHRDIKPGNILLERNVERVLLTDFGLARAADDASLTQSGVIAGTPQYMSPEQAHGEQIDHRTDLFSLGTVLYTLLAGHSPFRAETTMGVLRRVCEDTPRPLREINPNVPVWLEAFVEKLHAKRPSQRFDNAQIVAEQLKGCLAHVQEPTLVTLPTQVAELTKHRQKKKQPVPWANIAAGIATTSLLVLTAGLWAIAQPTRLQKNPTNPKSYAGQVPTEAPDWDDEFQRTTTEIERRLQKLESQSIDDF